MICLQKSAFILKKNTKIPFIMHNITVLTGWKTGALTIHQSEGPVFVPFSVCLTASGTLYNTFSTC